MLAEKHRFPLIEEPRILAYDQEHMSVIILVDKSGSVSGEAIQNINANLNHFKENVCENEIAAKCVDVCIVSFDSRVSVVQDWCPIREMAPVQLTADGGTELNGAIMTGVKKLRERNRLYAKNGIVEKKPYMIVMTDGYGGNINQAAALVERRIKDGKMKLFFLGFGDYDKATAAQLCRAHGNWCFEVNSGSFNFNDFFDFVGNSVKAASVSAPGEDIRVDTSIGTADSDISIVALP